MFSSKETNRKLHALDEKLNLILDIQEEIMVSLDNLNAQLAELETDVTAVKAKVDALKASQTVGVPEADVQAAADRLAAVHVALQASVQ